MNRGGIFTGPNALGIYGMGATGSSCTPDDSALIKRVQTYLQSHGAPSIHVDGQWQGCTASAFNKVFGHQWVTLDDMAAMGIQCSSDDATFGGILPAFTLAAASVCTDGSDGVPAGGGTQQCPAGQQWNDIVKTCVPTGIPALPGTTTPADTTQPAAGGCPAGQISLFGACIPDPSKLLGGTSPTTPQNCPQGTVLTPAGCVGQQGVSTPTVCPQGQMQLPILGTCVPDPTAIFSGGGGTAPAGGCPAGQINVPFLGCMGNPLAKSDGKTGSPTDIFGGLMTTIGGLFGGGATPVNCPAGSIYNASTKGCISAAGPVDPLPAGFPSTLPAAVASPFGGMGWVIGGIMAVGVAAVGYHFYKKHKEEQDFGGDMGFGDLGLGDMGFGGEDMYGMDAYSMYPNRKRRGKKARKSGKGRRRGRGRRRSCR